MNSEKGNIGLISFTGSYFTRKDLNNNGIISHKKALEKAHKEYEKYITKTLTPVERDYIEIINKELKNFKEVNK